MLSTYWKTLSRWLTRIGASLRRALRRTAKPDNAPHHLRGQVI
jgi:hypothetical protein